MDVKRLSVDYSVYQDVMIRLLALARQVQDGENYKPTKQMPSKDALETTLIMVLSGCANSGIYSRKQMLEISRELVKYFDAPEGPKKR